MYNGKQLYHIFPRKFYIKQYNKNLYIYMVFLNRFQDETMNDEWQRQTVYETRGKSDSSHF